MRGGEKGLPAYDLPELAGAASGDWVVLTGCRKSVVRRALETGGLDAADAALKELVGLFGFDNVVVELNTHSRPTDCEVNDALADLASRNRLLVVASNNTHYARPKDFPLYTAMAAIRARKTLDEMDGWLPAADIAYVRSPLEMAFLFRRWPAAVEAGAELADECAFELKLIAPELPRFPVPDGHTVDSWLREVTLERAAHRITLLQQEIQEFYSAFHVTRDLLELRNLVTVADLIVKSAQARHESRGLHFSRDYPQAADTAQPTTLQPPR